MAALPDLTAVPVPTWGRWYWPAYLTLGVAAFTGPELGAVATNAVNTLSDFSWWQLDVYPGEPLFAHTGWWWAALAVWLAVAGVLTAHIWFGKP